MGVECYDCCICKEKGINNDDIRGCFSCHHSICVDCFNNNKEKYEKYINEDSDINKMCPDCEIAYQNKMLVMDLIKISDMKPHNHIWFKSLNDLFKKVKLLY